MVLNNNNGALPLRSVKVLAFYLFLPPIYFYLHKINGSTVKLAVLDPKLPTPNICCAETFGAHHAGYCQVVELLSTTIYHTRLHSSNDLIIFAYTSISIQDVSQYMCQYICQIVNIFIQYSITSSICGKDFGRSKTGRVQDLDMAAAAASLGPFFNRWFHTNPGDPWGFLGVS